jgi:hypothetical protein
MQRSKKVIVLRCSIESYYVELVDVYLVELVSEQRVV